MELGKFQKHRSWMISGGIALVVGLWLLSGQFGNDSDDTVLQPAAASTAASGADKTRSSVRTRTQSAEEVRRTIIVNGKTAPARIVELSAETDGRVVRIGAERGANVDRGTVIVRLDERDRSARLAEAQATVKQREVEFQARDQLKT
ncbi:MAG: biotin/lipoyl-binding protein, partial [Gammaproteobacteria bacterium]|nr:biotin/lipoyl-binding protein [Gammaproteobacteria bacterium]